MATAKKPPIKKATKTTVRTAKKAPAKKPAKTKRAVASRSQRPTFMTLTPTVETIYWLILGALVIILAVWVASLTIKVQNIYNQIEVDNAQNSVVAPTTKHHKQ